MHPLDPQLLTPHAPRRLRRARIALFLSLILFLIALVNPRWGRSDDRGILQGRDLVVLIDLSKSMLAEDVGNLTRAQAVQQGLRDLLDTLSRRGGHRVGFVVFATEAWILSPLTSDYDFLLQKIAELDPNYPPPETLAKDEDSRKSGTQIGEAIRVGIEVHDSRFPGYQDILLLSDGEDPDELKGLDVGVAAARHASIPVHVIGVGDPTKKSILFRSEVPLEVTLQEAALKKLAIEAKGDYASWPGAVPRVGNFFQKVIESRPSRDVGDLALPQQEPRYRWFLIPALVLLLLAWRR